MGRGLLFVVASGFTSGVFLRSFFDFGFAFTLFLFFVGVTLLLWWIYARHKGVLLVSLALFSVLLGIVRFEVATFGTDPALDARVTQNITLKGVVDDEPDERASHTNLVVSVESIQNDERWMPAHGRVLVAAERFPLHEYGEEVVVRGVLKHPENFVNEDTGREFDYVGYLKKDGISYQMFYPSIEVVDVGKGNIVKEKLFALKRALTDSIAARIPEPHAALLGGVLVGAKRSMSDELLDKFRETGLIHIVVLSGYNVTIVAESIMRAVSFLPFAVSMSLGSLSIILFALLTGAGATVVRASIMALLVVVARGTGRDYEIKRALFVAAILMIMHNPYVLAFDVSFQLSFLATVGLLYVAPILVPYLRIVPERFGLREIAAATLATQLFVLPWLLYVAGNLSLVALPVNLLVLILVPTIMLVGFLAAVTGFISGVLAIPFAFVSYLLLGYVLGVVDLFSRVPFAQLTFEHVSLVFVVAIYLLYIAVLRVLSKRTHVSLTNTSSASMLS